MKEIKIKLPSWQETTIMEMERGMNESAHEPVVCKWFGCGKHLTAEEQLYGDICIHHPHEHQFDYGKLFPENGMQLEEIE